MSASLARIIAVLAVAALATGCVDLEPRQSNIRYYVLGGEDPQGAASAAPEADTDAPVVGLRRLRIASYLDTPTIVTRMGPHEVHFAEFHRWGEDLPSAINRSVARHLASHDAVARVDVVPWPDRATHAYVAQVHVLRFEGRAPPPPPGEDIDLNDERGLRRIGEPGTVRLVATWEITDPATESVVVQGRTEQTLDDWAVGDYGTLVQRLDESLRALAGDIGEAVRRAENRPAPSRR
jgi:hypothetical protein